MNAPVITFLLGFLLAVGASAEPYDDLKALLSQKASQDKKYTALRALVSEGEAGWKLLFQALTSDLSPRGDDVRSIEALWETTGVPKEMVSGWMKYKAQELEVRCKNETWAILYAQAHWRSLPDGIVLRAQGDFDLFNGRLTSDLPKIAETETWRWEFALRRVYFLDDDDCPLHTVQWNESDPKKRLRIANETVAWWKNKRATHVQQPDDGPCH